MQLRIYGFEKQIHNSNFLRKLFQKMKSKGEGSLMESAIKTRSRAYKIYLSYCLWYYSMGDAPITFAKTFGVFIWLLVIFVDGLTQYANIIMSSGISSHGAYHGKG